jgi:hypothetical protein
MLSKIVSPLVRFARSATNICTRFRAAHIYIFRLKSTEGTIFSPGLEQVLSFTGYWRILGVGELQVKVGLAVSFLPCSPSPSIRQYPVNDSTLNRWV